MNIVSFNKCGLSTVNYCESRLKSGIIESIKKEGIEGLSDTQKINEDLSQSAYIPVLKAIWTEQNKSKRLEWLRNQASQLHAPLMYEQAIAEFTQSPTIDTINLISIPLIKAANLRVVQDAKCCSEGSVYNGDAGQRMEMVYIKSLDNQAQKLLKQSLQSILKDNQEARVSAIKKKVLETAELSLKTDLPKPDWIGWHGLEVYISGTIQMHPADQHKLIRDKFAKEFLEANGMNKNENSTPSDS